MYQYFITYTYIGSGDHFPTFANTTIEIGWPIQKDDIEWFQKEKSQGNAAFFRNFTVVFFKLLSVNGVPVQ